MKWKSDHYSVDSRPNKYIVELLGSFEGCNLSQKSREKKNEKKESKFVFDWIAIVAVAIAHTISVCVDEGQFLRASPSESIHRTNLNFSNSP